MFAKKECLHHLGRNQHWFMDSTFKVVTKLIIIIIILGSYIALFLLLAHSTLHSITPARIASLGNLTYCCHARHRSQYPLKLPIYPLSGERHRPEVNILPKDVIPHETVGISGKTIYSATRHQSTTW